ncbi:MAG: hypothetical protein LBK54_03735 [Propionibacteriaceae bacterium]|nr:hypothetical protein [Propionibacteriaceae bacterium]
MEGHDHITAIRAGQGHLVTQRLALVIEGAGGDVGHRQFLKVGVVKHRLGNHRELGIRHTAAELAVGVTADIFGVDFEPLDGPFPQSLGSVFSGAAEAIQSGVVDGAVNDQ